MCALDCSLLFLFTNRLRQPRQLVGRFVGRPCGGQTSRAVGLFSFVRGWNGFRPFCSVCLSVLRDCVLGVALFFLSVYYSIKTATSTSGKVRGWRTTRVVGNNRHNI